MVAVAEMIEDVCGELGIEKIKCDRLKAAAMSACPVCREAPAGFTRTGRRRSRWQECISKHLKGTGKFGPEAIREAAKLYRKGECP